MWRSALHSLTEDTFSSPRVVTWVVSTTTFILAGTHVLHVDSNVTERLQEELNAGLMHCLVGLQTLYIPKGDSPQHARTSGQISQNVRKHLHIRMYVHTVQVVYRSIFSSTYVCIC